MQDWRAGSIGCFTEQPAVLRKSRFLSCPRGLETRALSEAGRVCFEELRRWRRERADKEGIPSFVIAKNSHLIEIINKEISSLEALKQIKGFGGKKVEKYRREITQIIQAFFKEGKKDHEG